MVSVEYTATSWMPLPMKFSRPNASPSCSRATLTRPKLNPRLREATFTSAQLQAAGLAPGHVRPRPSCTPRVSPAMLTGASCRPDGPARDVHAAGQLHAAHAPVRHVQRAGDLHAAQVAADDVRDPRQLDAAAGLQRLRDAGRQLHAGEAADAVGDQAEREAADVDLVLAAERHQAQVDRRLCRKRGGGAGGDRQGGDE